MIIVAGQREPPTVCTRVCVRPGRIVECWSGIKIRGDDAVFCVTAKDLEGKDDQKFLLDVVVQGQYINSNRTAISNTVFSLPYSGLDLSSLPITKAADILNLHWVARYQSLLTLKGLFFSEKNQWCGHYTTNGPLPVAVIMLPDAESI